MERSGRRGHAPVVFDEVAWAEDMALTSPNGRKAAAAERADVERHGLGVERLLPCLAEGPDRTLLKACVKTYVPQPAGPFGMVFAIRRKNGRLVLSFIAFGVRHHSHRNALFRHRQHAMQDRPLSVVWAHAGHREVTRIVRERGPRRAVTLSRATTA